MRITEQQKQNIRQVVATLVEGDARVILFGSRVDDTQKGGDIDLLIRQFHGRKVDVLLSAPNLKSLPIHTIAQQQGITL